MSLCGRREDHLLAESASHGAVLYPVRDLVRPGARSAASVSRCSTQGMVFTVLFNKVDLVLYLHQLGGRRSASIKSTTCLISRRVRIWSILLWDLRCQIRPRARSRSSLSHFAWNLDATKLAMLGLHSWSPPSLHCAKRLISLEFLPCSIRSMSRTGQNQHKPTKREGHGLL